MIQQLHDLFSALYLSINWLKWTIRRDLKALSEQLQCCQLKNQNQRPMTVQYSVRFTVEGSFWPLSDGGHSLLYHARPPWKWWILDLRCKANLLSYLRCTCFCSPSHHLEPVGLFPNVLPSTCCAGWSKWGAPKVREFAQTKLLIFWPQTCRLLNNQLSVCPRPTISICFIVVFLLLL